MKMRAQHIPSRISIAGILALSAALLVLAGCAKSKQVKLSFEGKSDMNGGYACLVCIYQLKSDTSFAAMPLEAFWSATAPPFQADLAVAPRTEVMLEPGETKELKIKISKETKFIGAAADFRRPDRDAWRKILPISSKKGLLPVSLRKDKKIILIISAGGIEIKT
ncbi:MAG: type VI secretion system-associated lipoprotein [Candidatus Aminicenantes bacterium RBG_13_59_9]|nr:MAG: type VI secretion system-associated lipoprotein [Candidatus Aminicenantes bacterium RBG_13_59_9]